LSDTAPSVGIKRLRALSGGGGGALVELVEIDGQPFVLKRSSPARAAGERRFQRALAAAGLPSLAVADHPALQADELLLEYVEGSPTIGGSPLPVVCARWGAAVAGMHGVGGAESERLDSEGEVVRASWPEFVDRLMDRALGAQRDHETDLPPTLLTKAETCLSALRDFAPRRFVLTHGDLHVNNALLRGAEVVLFDKASGVWSCPAVFDLALVFSEGFPGARYGVGRPGDDERMAAFMAAYGELAESEAPWLDHFALAHDLMRYPSPFVPDLRQVIEAVLERIST
jgi:Ser/Thr protein kinase RdoA (MazF antagonist)